MNRATVSEATPEPKAAVLLLFVDGVGLGADAPDNPFCAGSMPFLEGLMGGPLTLSGVSEATVGEGRLFAAIDASLGVDGLPQSATGQTALFTGINAPRALGRHVTAFPGRQLRAILDRESVFRRVVEDGGSSTFANAFSPRYYELLSERRVKKSASVFAVEAAGIELRGLEDLRSGMAVSWDIEGDLFTSGLSDDPAPLRYSAEAAGVNLAGLVASHDLTLYETFLPDLAGHKRLELPPRSIVARLDRMLAGLLRTLEDRGRPFTVVVTSDHGNFEDLSHRRHTRNLVPLLALGQGSERFESARSLIDIAPILFTLSRR